MRLNFDYKMLLLCINITGVRIDCVYLIYLFFLGGVFLELLDNVYVYLLVSLEKIK